MSKYNYEAMNLIRNNKQCKLSQELKEDFPEISIEDKTEMTKCIKTSCSQAIIDIDKINTKLSSIKGYKVLTGHILFKDEDKFVAVPVHDG